MRWRDGREDARRRLLEHTDAAHASRYDELAGDLSPDDAAAHLADLRRVVALEPGLRVLDAGAGTGTLCALLASSGGLAITALEPAPAMLERLRRRPGLEGVVAKRGFCDAPEDRAHFAPASFDLVMSRQLANTLFDPLAAFDNWHDWLVPGGAVVLMDGLFDRDAWSGDQADEVDALPLAAYRTRALVPYLLESRGFEIEHVGPMEAVNARPSTRTPRYVVVARRPA